MKHSLLPILMLAIPGLSFAQKTYHGDGPDNVLRLMPIAAVVTMKLCSVDSRSDWRELAVCGGSSLVLTAATTWGLKTSINDSRPDGTGYDAFPSGHSAIAFAGARVLDKEFRHVSPWISVAGYTVATATAIDRVSRNRHRWDDVLAGAAIGIGATELGYWLGGKIMKRYNNSMALGVAPGGMYFAMSF